MKSLLFTLLIAIIANCQNFVELNVSKFKRDKVLISANIDNITNADSCYIYRSYYNLNILGEIDLNEYPICKRVFKISNKKVEFIDSLIADNCKYFYYLKVKTKNGKVVPSTIDSVTISDIILPQRKGEKVDIFIDKKNYVLEIRYNKIAVKKFPINLGLKPWNRKLHFDKLSTPEGRYKITHFNYQSSFHKSIGVSYPNNIDRKRYSDAKKMGKLPLVNNNYPDIGGSITIHGGGVGNNWTWGCIAMRNSDVDEILAIKGLKAGTPIYITGNEIRRKDLY